MKYINSLSIEEDRNHDFNLYVVYIIRVCNYYINILHQPFKNERILKLGFLIEDSSEYSDVISLKKDIENNLLNIKRLSKESIDDISKIEYVENLSM